MAADLVQAMASLGYDRFAVAGHDRGGRVAYRMALDHPAVVTALAVLDIVPTAEVWARADDRMAIGYWHWGFLAQPAPLPERLIGGAPDAFFDSHVQRGWGSAATPSAIRRGAGRLPRAAARPRRRAGRCARTTAPGRRSTGSSTRPTAGRQIDCPVLALWGQRGALEIFYDDVLGVWRPWASDLRGHGVDASHFLVEDAPDEVAAELLEFFERAERGA